MMAGLLARLGVKYVEVLASAVQKKNENEKLFTKKIARYQPSGDYWKDKYSHASFKRRLS